jgi:surface protein
MFYGAKAFNQPLDAWDVSRVTNMESMFRRAIAFNKPLDSWKMSNVETISHMFSGYGFMDSRHCRDYGYYPTFNQPLVTWDLSRVTSMNRMFGCFARNDDNRAFSFQQPLEWNTGSLQTTEGMFFQNWVFNNDIQKLNVSQVRTMESMFQDAQKFNHSLSTWDTRKVENMAHMFDGAKDFDQPIQAWDVGRVTDMKYMFHNTNEFNQPLLAWEVSRVTTMVSMFEEARDFNQPILNSWNIPLASKQEMFKASAMNQIICTEKSAPLKRESREQLMFEGTPSKILCCHPGSILKRAGADRHGRIRHLPPPCTLQAWGGSQFTIMTLWMRMGYSQTPEIENGRGAHCHFSWFANIPSTGQGHGEW